MEANGALANAYDSDARAIRMTGSRGQELAYIEQNDDQGPITSVVDLTNLSRTFTKSAGPAYVELFCPFISVASNTATVNIYITDGSNNVLAKSGMQMAAGTGIPLRCQARITGAAGSYTVKGRVIRTVGTGTVTVGVDTAIDANFWNVLRVVQG